MRRPSSGAQLAGRGGAGNVFRADEVPRQSVEYAVDDASSSKSVESLAKKSKQFILGRK